MSKSNKSPKYRRGNLPPTASQRRARRERKRKFQIIFINGKQQRVPRPPTIDSMPVDEFIARNADPLWYHQNEMWEFMPVDAPFPQIGGPQRTVPDSSCE